MARRRRETAVRAVGGIGRRNKILTRESFSDFILAYVGVGPKQFKVHCAAVTTGDKPRLSWGDISFDGALFALRFYGIWRFRTQLGTASLMA